MTKEIIDKLGETINSLQYIMGYFEANNEIKKGDVKQKLSIIKKSSKIIYLEDYKNNLTTNAIDSDLNNFKENEMAIKRKYGTGFITKRTRKNKDGTTYTYYRAVYLENGIRKEKTAKTQAECLKILQNALKEIKPENKQRKTITYNQWIDYWVLHHKNSNKENKSLTMHINQVKRYFDKINIKSLKTDNIQSYLQTIKGSNTRQKIYDIINSSLKKALDYRIISYNPCAPIDRPKHKNKQKECFSYANQNLMLTYLPDKYKAVFFFLCCTGLRIGEFLALSIKDFKNNKIIINKEIVDKKLILSTKTNKERYVPFTNELIKTTYKLAKTTNFFGQFTYDMIKNTLYRTKKKLNIKANLSIHSTRHTFATVCYDIGIKEKKIQEWLGHSTLAMTQDIYTHLTEKGDSIIKDYLIKLDKEN